MLGTVLICGRRYQAFRADGGPLGEFQDQRSAVRAVVDGAPTERAG
jgi:hypothetical protein